MRHKNKLCIFYQMLCEVKTTTAHQLDAVIHVMKCGGFNTVLYWQLWAVETGNWDWGNTKKQIQRGPLKKKLHKDTQNLYWGDDSPFRMRMPQSTHWSSFVTRVWMFLNGTVKARSWTSLKIKIENTRTHKYFNPSLTELQRICREEWDKLLDAGLQSLRGYRKGC